MKTCMRRMLAGVLVVNLAAWSIVQGDEPAAADTTQTAERQALLKEMRAAAQAMKVVETASGEEAAAELATEPIFRYSDEQRDIRDATMWVWTVHGRPSSLMKLERYGYPQPERKWLFNVVSVSPQTLQVTWPFEREFASKKPGFVFQPLPDGPTASDNKSTRLSQIKQLSRRFSSTMLRNPAVGTKDEMRLLPTPLFRYASDSFEIMDGALFGLSATGTNPDAVVAIELRGTAPKTAEWHYGLTGMTNGGLSVRLDEKEVWTQPFLVSRGQVFETWTWFFSPRTE